jgi:hypothetical protein
MAFIVGIGGIGISIGSGLFAFSTRLFYST